jgi:NADPH:quinone reductase-like Zn-dependent oxidoreductase
MGVNALTVLFEHPDLHQAARRTVIDLLATGRVQPPVGGVFRLDELHDVCAALAERKIDGKAVLQVAPV